MRQEFTGLWIKAYHKKNKVKLNQGRQDDKKQRCKILKVARLKEHITEEQEIE